MKKGMWVTAAACAVGLFIMNAFAFAADLPTKEIKLKDLPIVPCTPQSCSGWYLGAAIEGAGPIGTGQADLTSGAGIGGVVGYQFWNGSIFFAAEVGANGYFGTSTFTAADGTTFSPGPWSVDYEAKFGYGLQGLFNTGNGTTTPSQGLFANLNANLLSPYAEVGGRTRQFNGVGVITGFASGAGIEYAIGNGWNLDVDYRHIIYDVKTPVVNIGFENVARIMVKRMF